MHLVHVWVVPSADGSSPPPDVSAGLLGSGYRHVAKSDTGRQYRSIRLRVSRLALRFSAASVATRLSRIVPTEGWVALSGLGRREIDTAAWWIADLYAFRLAELIDISASCSRVDV